MARYRPWLTATSRLSVKTRFKDPPEVRAGLLLRSSAAKIKPLIAIEY